MVMDEKYFKFRMEMLICLTFNTVLGKDRDPLRYVWIVIKLIKSFLRKFYHVNGYC